MTAVEDVAHRASDDGPTLGEISRGLEGLRAEVRQLAGVYIRRDVYDVQLKAIQKSVDDLSEDFKAMTKRTRDNRLIAVTGLALPLLVLIFGAIILSVLPHG